MADALRATIDFTLSWTTFCGEHSDTQRVHLVDFSHDTLPGDFAEKLAELKIGESHSDVFSAGMLLGANYSIDAIKSFPANKFKRTLKGQHIEPKLYRYYPTPIAREGLGAAQGDLRPFRITSISNESISADTNHPLAKYYLTLSATIVKHSPPSENKDRPSRNIARLITSKGSGMQVPFEFGDTALFSEYPLKREDESVDTMFYSTARLTHHIDAVARTEISKLYSELIEKDSKVLDLMSSWESHLNPDLDLGEVTGLGLNKEELSANKQLNDFVVHDLNMNQILPFEDGQFDTVICTASIEYLTYPLKIMTEISRVLKPGGKFIVTFSDRWFPTKAVNLWGQLHPFERMQLVLEYFRDSGEFEELNTFSQRGLIRPRNDPYYETKKFSDPLFAVWGQTS